MKVKSDLANHSAGVSLSTSESDAPVHPRNEPFLQRILVPVDFSECSMRAMDFAVRLAADVHARLVLLHVVEGTSYHIEPGAEESYQHALEGGRERLAEVVKKRTSHHRVAAELLVRIGRAGSEIPDTAKALGTDLIVLGAQGESPLKSVPLGSTAERVLRHAACPVLTVR